MIEQWKAIEGWEGYEVSDQGNVRSFRRPGKGSQSTSQEPVLRKLVKDKNGYLRVNLSVNGNSKLRGVHQLVAEAFLAESKFEGALVRHKDDVPSNNTVGNLEWGTAADNTRDRIVNNGLTKYRQPEEIREIRRLYELGFTQREIARVFRTTQNYVHSLVARKQRKDVE